MGEELLRPTRIYVSPVLHLLEKYKILGIAHITGGGLLENIPRVLPEVVSVQIDKNSWPKPFIFSLIKKEGKISDEEMYRTFNMGIGMALVVRQKEALEILKALRLIGYNSCIIGKIIKGNKQIIVG